MSVLPFASSVSSIPPKKPPHKRPHHPHVDMQVLINDLQLLALVRPVALATVARFVHTLARGLRAAMALDTNTEQQR